MSIVVPKVIDMGAGPLVELSYLEDTLHISRKAAFAYLSAMHIQPVFVGKEAYFSRHTFQRVMHVLTKPGGPGFAFPGSTPRANDMRLREITPELMAQAMDPVTAMEMEVAKSNDSMAVRRLLMYTTSAEKAKSKEKPDE